VSLNILLDQDKSIQHFVVRWPLIFCISNSCQTAYVFLKQYVYMTLFRNDSTFTDMEANQNIPELLNENAIYFTVVYVRVKKNNIQQTRD